MSFLKKIKHKTAIAKQAMKGKSPDNDTSGFKEADEKLTMFCDAIKTLFEDVQNFQKSFPDFFKNISEIGQDFVDGSKLLTDNSQQFVSQSGEVILKVGEHSTISNDLENKVISKLNQINEKLKELKKLSSDRKDTLLLLESNKQKLEGYQKSKKEAEAAKYEEKIQTREQELNNQTITFINEIDTLSSHWNETIDDIVTQLNTVIFEAASNVLNDFSGAINLLPPEDLQNVFPVTQNTK